MIIKNINPFIGIHCETTTTGCLLNQLGIELSEPMLFGLGEGLSFIFWHMKSMDFPFIGGRIKQLELTKNIAGNLHLSLEIQETTSVKKAWDNVKRMIDEGQVAGLQLDSYYLEYFAAKIHFAGHFVAMYGYDEKYAYLVDTKPNGGCNKTKTSLKSLEMARSEKGPMSAKNLMYSLQRTKKECNLSEVIIAAIANNAKAYLNPPIENISYKGILKTSVEIKKWFERSSAIEYEFSTTAMLMEKGGTGGALFRNLYRDFLQEAYSITKLEPIQMAHYSFIEIAEMWTKVATLLDKAGKNKGGNLVSKASEILAELSQKEYSVMKLLEKVQ